jgi:hypothetical protein
MTTTNIPGSVPGSVQRTDDPNTPGRVRGGETKAFFKTTQFIVFIVATVGVLLASYFVKARRAP